MKENSWETRVTRAIYPGSFDPVTFGHLDIIERAAKVMDELIVAVLNNNLKSPLFSVDERVKMLKEVTADFPNVQVEAFSGLLVDFAKKSNAGIIIRGLRAITDFEYELQMAQTNRIIYPEIDTMFFTTNIDYSYLSSSTVREIARYNGKISRFVPDVIAEKVYNKMKGLNEYEQN